MASTCTYAIPLRRVCLNIQVFASNTKEFNIQDGYEKIPNDLNKGAGGRYIYLCYTRNEAFPPITAVYVIQSPKREVYPPSAGWVRIDWIALKALEENIPM